MTKPSVKFKIEAEDEASAKVAEARANVEKAVDRIKSTTGTTKTTSEFIGSFASALGGSEIGNIAGQFGGLNEKVGQFTELSKAGGAGAMAMKVGLAGVVAYASFELGKGISNAVFETEKWNTKLAQAKEELAAIGIKSMELANTRFADDFAEIKLIEDPEQQAAELKKLMTGAGNNAESYGKQLAAVQKQIQELAGKGGIGAALGAAGDLKSGNFASAFDNASNVFSSAKLEELKAQEANLRSLLDAEEKRVSDVQRFQGRESEDAAIAKAKAEQDKLTAAKEAAALADDKAVETLRTQLAIEQAIGKEKFKLQAAQMASSDAKREEIAALLEQQDALAKLRIEEDKKQKAAEAELAQQEKLNALRDSELQKLKERELLITQGAEASTAAKLAAMGLAKADADFIAQEQARLDKLEADKQQKGKIADASSNMQPLQAVESRFLRSGVANDPQKQLNDTASKMEAHLAKLIAIQEAAGNTENADRLRKKSFELEPIA